MRTLLTATMEVTASNKAVMDGSLPKIVKDLMDKIHPEAAYFYTVDGCRSCFMVFDLKDPSEIPGIAEPLFNGMGARINFSPVMNPDDLQKGLEAWQKSQA
jgi:hypothetical protein